MASQLPVVRFGSTHPFWDEAIALRKYPSAKSISEILDIAHSAGHTDLEYHHINRGLKKAPADLHLPATTSKFLQKKYSSISSDFDSLEIMKNLTFEALTKIRELEEELEDESLSQTRRMAIDNQIWKWYGRAMDWSTKCSEIVIKYRSMENSAVSGPIIASHDDIEAQSRRLESIMADLRADFNSKLPTPPAELLGVYGTDNVKLPGRDIGFIEDNEE